MALNPVVRARLFGMWKRLEVTRHQIVYDS